MKGILFKISKLTILFLLVIQTQLKSQILRDSASLNLVKKGIDYIYNLRFSEAEKVSKKLSEAYPGHPVIYLIRGMGTYWENFPILPTSPTRAAFEKDMRKCIELCAEKHNPEDDAEFLLANLSARGMLLLYYADNDLSLEVVPLTTSTYQYIRRSFEFTSAYNDFYFFTGLYNYYREEYPEAYPIYKTLAFLFPKGSKAEGIKQLQGVAKKSILFKAESSTFLTEIYLSFENNYEVAYAYSKSLHELYPDNFQYLSTYIKNLLLVKHYDEAENLMKDCGSKNDNPYFQAQLQIFNGILQEKKYHDFKLAEQYYTNGLMDISLFGPFGNEFAAYGYFGLSRISGLNGDKKFMKTYHKQASELADFKKVDFD